MAYVYTGTARSLYFTLTKTVGGVAAQGYPRIYNGQLSWGDPSYPTLTDTQLKRLSDAEYDARLAAFLAHVESIEAGFDASTDFTNTATKTDLTSCPPPPTTTTTTLAPTTTTTLAPTTTTTTTP